MNSEAQFYLFLNQCFKKRHICTLIAKIIYFNHPSQGNSANYYVFLFLNCTKNIRATLKAFKLIIVNRQIGLKIQKSWFGFCFVFLKDHSVWSIFFVWRIFLCEGSFLCEGFFCVNNLLCEGSFYVKDLYTCLKDPSGSRIFLCEGSFGEMDPFFVMDFCEGSLCIILCEGFFCVKDLSVWRTFLCEGSFCVKDLFEYNVRQLKVWQLCVCRFRNSWQTLECAGLFLNHLPMPLRTLHKLLWECVCVRVRACVYLLLSV